MSGIIADVRLCEMMSSLGALGHGIIELGAWDIGNSADLGATSAEGVALEKIHENPPKSGGS